MAAILYVLGDATKPQGEGKKIITHICNDIGAWGAGFVMAISKRWPEPEEQYHPWVESIPMADRLGKIQIVDVEPDIAVANMIAQHGVGSNGGGKPPIRYGHLGSCLMKVVEVAKQRQASIHMPRIGCGLAGGKWEVVEDVIKRAVIKDGIDVTVYDFGGK